MASKILKNDMVIIKVGKDKGKKGRVIQVSSKEGKISVEGINLKKKHVKPNPNLQEKGGVKAIESFLSISNVAIYNEETKMPDRVGFKILETGEKIRVYKKTGKSIDSKLGKMK